MRVATLLLILVCAFEAGAQKIEESASRLFIRDGQATVRLAVTSAASTPTDVSLRILDPNEKVAAQYIGSIPLQRGSKIYTLKPFAIGDLVNNAGYDLAWYRLAYSVGASSGIISLSELMKDDFDLRAAAVERVVPGQSFVARVRAINPVSEAAVQDVTVRVQLVIPQDGEKDLVLAGTGRTGSNGLSQIALKVPDGVRPDDDPTLRITAEKGGIIRKIDEELSDETAADSVYMTTDKPLYQPGQHFDLRAVYFDANSTVVVGSELEFTIEDEDDTVVYRQRVRTSDFGIAAIGWQIPENAKLGQYTVRVEGDHDLRQDRIWFRVSRYDLPNFKVSTTPDKSYYGITDAAAEVTISADYLFGKPVPGGKIRVVQESDRRWNYKTQKYEADQGQAVEGIADSDGKYVARIDLSRTAEELRSNEWRRFDDVSFAAYVTDPSTNRTEQRRFDLRVTKQPIHIYLTTALNDRPDLPVTAFVTTYYADGTPALCTVEVSDVSGNVERVRTNKLGGARLQLHPPRSFSDRRYDLRIQATDKQGRVGTSDESVYFTSSDVVHVKTDKSIYKPGDMIEVDLFSDRQDDLIYVDVAKDFTAIDQHMVRLRGGKAHLTIPYRPEFSGELVIAAFGDRSAGRYSGDMRETRGIVFPAQQNLVIDAKFSKNEYRPAENASLKFSVRDGSGRPVESALGLSIFDRAVEERARTDSEFHGYFWGFYGLLGYGRAYGGITLKDLNDLDTSQPISEELQLAAEIMLANEWYSPAIFHSDDRERDAGDLYASRLRDKLQALRTALQLAGRGDDHPTDAASLVAVLKRRSIDFAALRDPWGSGFVPEFAVDRAFDVLTLKSAGPDKRAGTPDDFIIFTESFSYFSHTAEAIRSVAELYHQRTGAYIRDLPTLSTELRKQGVDPSRLEDKWGRDYRIEFGVTGRTYTITVTSAGTNGTFDDVTWGGDDFVLATSALDYFGGSELAINRVLDEEVNKGKKPFPRSADEFRTILAKGGIDLASVKDGYGHPVYLAAEKTFRYSDKTTTTAAGSSQKTTVVPVTEEVMIFHLRGTAEDGDNSHGPVLATFSGVITEAYRGTGFQAAEVKTIPFTGAMGAIRGVVTDMNGAVVPGAKITATDEADDTKIFSTESDSEGNFVIGNVPAGSYRVAVTYTGFSPLVLDQVIVRSHNAIELKLSLTVASASATVDVTSTANGFSLNTTEAQVSTTVSRSAAAVRVPVVQQQNSTPRLREYFPETLYWQPELVTDKRGRAEAAFKMADSITAWKMFAIATTKKGKVGVVEKEVTSFQPFFVDLDPPKFLTQGDEIYLPTQVRNYTARAEKVDVSLDPASWFTPLSPLKSAIDVEAGSTKNAVFGFRASEPVLEGKQRVTAIARGDSDAIEKPVTVRPNGEEIARPESRIFSGSTTFDLSFPSESLAGTRRAELKIYPNLFSHVSESVEGLLMRPYGCGEQTISSTYPNLMILRFIKQDTPVTRKARKYLQKGYERLLSYRSADGGFTFWGGRSEPDAALTAYAIRFLSDARGTIEVDEAVIDSAVAWLAKEQRPDGSWVKAYSWETAVEAERRAGSITSYAARSLAASGKGSEAVAKALKYLRERDQHIDEPYALALYGLTSLEHGDQAQAKAVADKLRGMAVPEGSAVFWKLETNTPFYGWGTAGRLETTALVVELLLRMGDDPNGDTAASRGLQFLLLNKDRYGVWYSTQATINVLQSLLTAMAKVPAGGRPELSVSVNGANVSHLQLARDDISPITIDLSDKLADTNRITVSGADSTMMAQLVARHYIKWSDSRSTNTDIGPSRMIKLDYKCDKLQPAVMEDVTCTVDAERVGSRGYGMLLAEIGTPPGAEVSREFLEAAVANDWTVSHYDVLPDRIVLYMWARPGGVRFTFKFHQRYRINAQTPASLAYDYYNPEASAVVQPLRFVTR